MKKIGKILLIMTVGFITIMSYPTKADSNQTQIETSETNETDERRNKSSNLGIIEELFPDKNLAQSIATTLGYESTGATLTDSDVQSLTILKANDANIVSLEGMEILKNIRSITLQRNQISDLGPLTALPKLIGLDLSSNKISDLGVLETIPSLISIAFSDNQITDISPLRTLTDLKTVYLSRNQITEMEPLENHDKIATLSLESNVIEDTHYLSTLTGLVNLYISNGQGNFSNLESLSALPKLKELYSSNNQIIDISPLQSIKSLKKLVLYNNRITDITPLEKLENLSFISLSYNAIYNVDSLKSLTNLKQLYIRGNHVYDLSPISSYYDNLTDYDFRDQTIWLDSMKLEENVSLESPLTNVNFKNDDFVFDNITDFGIHDSNHLLWDGLTNQQRTSFRFNNSDYFTGTVYQPFKGVDISITYTDEEGNQILETKTETFEIDEMYSINAPTLEGYTITGIESVSGNANTQSKHTFVYKMNKDITDPVDPVEEEKPEIPNKDDEQNNENSNSSDEDDINQLSENLDNKENLETENKATLPATGIHSSHSVSIALVLIAIGGVFIMMTRED